MIHQKWCIVQLEGTGYKGTKPGDYYAGVVVKRTGRTSITDQHLYVAEVMTYRKGARTTAPLSLTGGPSDTKSPNLYEILEHIADDVNLYEASDTKVEFSMDIPVEETDRLIALHNLT